MANESIIVEINSMIKRLSDLKESLIDQGMTESDLLNKLCRLFNMKPAELCSRSRKRPLVEARVIYAVLRRQQGATYVDIAEELNRNHSSVVNYTLKHKEWLKYDEEYRNKFLNVQYELCRK